MDLDKKRRRLVIARLRQIDAWGPARARVKKASKDRCSSCNKKTDKIVIDHIVPVFDPEEKDPFSTVLYTCICGICKWFRRLFVEAEGRQALCKECHQKKSNSENVIRREIKKNG